jgi:hypothetical protein
MADDYAVPGKRRTKRDLKKKAKQRVYKKGGAKRSEKKIVRSEEVENKKGKKNKRKK